MSDASAAEKFHVLPRCGVEPVGRKLVHRVDAVEEHDPTLLVIEEGAAR